MNLSSESLVDWMDRPAAPYSSGDQCLQPGCTGFYWHARDKAKGRHVGGRGYCHNHHRNILRAGHPLGRKEASLEELHEAALAWAEDPTSVGPLVDRLVNAAFGLLWPAHLPERVRDPSYDETCVLLGHAARYADADVDDDAGFLVLKERFEKSAHALARSCSAFHGKGQSHDPRHNLKEVA